NRKALQAQVESAAQEIKRREVELSYTTVKAAISGRISRAYLTVGNLVNAGGSDPLLTTIVSVDPMQVYFDIDERALQRYMASNPSRSTKDDAGQPKKMTVREQKLPFFFGLETEVGYPHRALMDFAENKVDPTTGTIQVRGEVANPEGRFVAGSRVRIRVPVSAPYQARLVPDTAVLTDQEKRYLLVVDKTNNNTVVRRDVQLGRLLDDGMRVILGDGVSPEDFVIVLGLQRARVNYPVEPLDAEARPVNAPQAGAGAEKPSK
nr:efflux RND transporter periplasmic adaptor subunit [Candidatus Anammoximicrobium sp.]